MTLDVLVGASDLKAAFERLQTQLAKGARSASVTIGWQGDNLKGTVHWRPEDQVWSFLRSYDEENRYLCWFGVQDPFSAEAPSSLSIACEINTPMAGVNRRLAGAFVRDASDKLYYAHLGRLGGGGKGVGKSAFLAWLGHERLSIVSWPGGEAEQAVVLGPIGRPRFVRDLARYVHETQRFKADVKARRGEAGASGRDLSATSFSPEFGGKRRSYKIANIIESRANHGVVVNDLAVDSHDVVQSG